MNVFWALAFIFEGLRMIKPPWDPLEATESGTVGLKSLNYWCTRPVCHSAVAQFIVGQHRMTLAIGVFSDFIRHDIIFDSVLLICDVAVGWMMQLYSVAERA